MTAQKPIRVLIVDDEPLARERVRSLLMKEEAIEIVGEAGDGKSALALIASKQPDLLFLDVQMPVMTGFDVIQAMPEETRPVVIFVTAYDQYAISAFEVHALDYLLKPFDAERFAASVDRARQYIQKGRLHELQARIAGLLSQLPSGGAKAPERLMIKESGRVHFLAIADIDWIEADGNYVSIHTGKETHLMRATMKEMEEKLDTATFRRIHRNCIVNAARIKELKTWFNGEYVAVLDSGKELAVSRRFRKNLDAML
jgi:two-component system, LytTR family, response regulator